MICGRQVINVDKHYSPFLSKTDLLRLKKIIDETVLIYNQYNIDDIEAERINNEKIEQAINFYKNGKKIDKKQNDKNGYVYIMYDDSTKQYKIGFSKKPEYREKTLQSEKPSIKMIFYHKSNMNIEKKLHNLYQDFRTRGEWFILNEQHIIDIKKLILNGTSL